jgi:hypothetical protein
MRYGMTAIQDDCLFLAIFFGTTQWRINRSLFLFDHAMHQGDVLTLVGLGLQLRGQTAVCQIIFGHHQQARGILIDAVDDSWPKLTIDRRQRRMIQQCVDLAYDWDAQAQGCTTIPAGLLTTITSSSS